MCLGMAIFSKIGRIVSGIDLDESGTLDIFKHLPSFYKKCRKNPEIKRGILKEECKKVFLQGEPVKRLIEGEKLNTNI
jgi:tRNA(Arg) A34 adenosine deaminase TadA